MVKFPFTDGTLIAIDRDKDGRISWYVIDAMVEGFSSILGAVGWSVGMRSYPYRLSVGVEFIAGALGVYEANNPTIGENV